MANKSLLILLLSWSIQKTAAQNLLANPGFEAINNCVEYKADCAVEAWFYSPAGNFLVGQQTAPRPFSGEMVLLVPIGNVMQNFNKPRYVYTRLCCPLVKGKMYNLLFHINTATIAFKELAVYFTATEPALTNTSTLPDSPSIRITQQHVGAQKKDGWRPVSYTYTATGDEQYFIFTTKGLAQVTYDMNNAMNKSGDILYFIDEISLQSQDSIPRCPQYRQVIDTLFDYNYRHTNHYPVFPIAIPQPPLVVFKNDTLTIPGLLFDVNKYNIKPIVAKKLDSLISLLQQREIIQINITGHTDSTGNEKDNAALSANRANSIGNYIRGQLPQLKDKITAAGKGASQPVSSNTSTMGRQKNRRVNIVITYVEK
jgi:outer membrane protein OmpA-like peptidoglycan-associated protein